MMKYLYVSVNKSVVCRLFCLFTVLVSFSSMVYSQQFNTDEQYNQAMVNAKQAFEAKQYSQAVLFYREAMKIKPDELLPKYKIEDIRTIYIEIEKDSMATNTATEPNKKSKKRKQAEQKLLEEKIVEQATAKMNKEAEKELADLQSFDVEVVQIVEDNDIIEEEEINDIVSNRESGINDVSTIKVKKVEGKSVKKEKELTLTEKKVPENKPKEQKTATPNKAPVQPKPVMTKPTYYSQKPQKMSEEQKQQWVKKENERLAKSYPNKKTVENIEKKGKKITRVIMNINNKVTIYMKVKHDWGATFYFKDEVGQELKSINQQYFNLMTNIETYAEH